MLKICILTAAAMTSLGSTAFAAANSTDPGCFGQARAKGVEGSFPGASNWDGFGGYSNIGQVFSDRAGDNANLNIEYMNGACGASIPASPN